MDIKVETIDACRRNLRVTLPVERVRLEIDRAYERLGRTARLDGFRPGKAPRRVLELHFAPRVHEEVKERLVDESFGEALRREGIEPAVSPRMDVKSIAISPAEPFSYQVEVETWPALRLGGYTGIKVRRRKEAVTDEDVDRAVGALLDRHAEFIPVADRPAEAGDFALLDIRGEADSAVFEERTGAWMEVAADAYLPGFGDRLIGMRPEETRTFALTLPAEVRPAQLGGKEASYTVTLREIKRKKAPALTDEFCRELGDYAAVDDLKRAVRADLEQYARAREDDRVLEQINDYLLEHTKVPLPPRRLDVETAALAERTAARLIEGGMPKEQIIEKKEELLAGARRQAERSLRLGRIYAEIVRREKIEVTAGEVEERIGRIAGQLKREPAEVRGALEKDGGLDDLREEILKRKVAGFLASHAKVREAKD
ncbi:MAG: trigger factor [bacterium]|nr:trigger factor [bacterium]